MAFINEVISLKQALQRGEETWEFMFNFFATADPTAAEQNIAVVPGPGAFGSENSPRGIQTVHGIAIGPRSQVDRCYVLWDPQATVDGTTDFFRRISVESPLTFPQIGNERDIVGGNFLAPIKALLFGASPQIIGLNPSLTDDSGSDSIFGNPFVPVIRKANSFATQFHPSRFPNQPTYNLLHLIFYLKAPPPAVPTKRFPHQISSDILLDGSVGVEEFIGSMSVYGRKRIRLSFSASQGDYSIRVGGNRWYEDPTGAGSSFQEKTYGSLASVTSNSPGRIELDNPDIDTLNVWGTRNATSPSVTGIGFMEARAVD